MTSSIKRVLLAVLAAILAFVAPAPSCLAADTEPRRPAGSPIAVPVPSDFPAPSPALTRRVEKIYERLRLASTSLEREQAMGELVDAGPEAIPLLLAELDRQASTWPMSIYALGAIGDRRIIPVLEKELQRQRGRSYMDVLYALSLAGEPTALRRALRSTNANIVFERSATAVDYIAGSKGPSAVSFLIDEIPRRSQSSRQAGLGALGTICDDSAVGFLLEWSRKPSALDRRYALIALARIGDRRGIKRMLEALEDDDPRVVDAAVEGLGYLRAEAAIEPLVELLKVPGPSKTALTASWSLGLIGGEQAGRAILARWAKAESTERALLVKALGKLKQPAAAPLLSEVAQGTDPLSLDAARALIDLDGQVGTDALLAVCTDAVNLDAGLAASHELTLRGDPRAGPCVIKWLKEEIDLRHRLSPTAEEMLLALPRSAPRGAAASLEALAEQIAAPALAHRIRAAARNVRLVNELGPEIDPWLQLLQSGTPHEVELAIDYLGSIEDTRAVEPLRRLFGQIEPGRAHLIPRALGAIKSERATPFLISLITDDLYRVPTLSRARNEAARALARCEGEKHVAKALREAYLAEKGRFFVPLLALANVNGAAGIDELVELKSILFRERGPRQVLRHERINWAIRLLRAGQEIPYDQIRDVN